MADLTFEEMSDNYDDHGAELAAKDAEIKRLRWLLMEGLRIDAGDFSVNVDDWINRVREALGE